MTTRSGPWIDAQITAYIAARATPPGEVERWLAAKTAELGRVSQMQIGADQGALMGLLVRLTGARQAIEIGTFTGMSALHVALAMPADGRILCCDVSEEWTSLARDAWEQAGVRDKIDLRIAPALTTLAALPTDTTFDFAFVDADKSNYGNYIDALAPMLRANALVLVDNTLWGGQVVEAPAADDTVDTVALRAFNDKVAVDDRFETYLLPVGDGLTLLRRR